MACVYFTFYKINRNEAELVEQIAMDILPKLEFLTSGVLERRINTYNQIAQQKLQKSLWTSNLADMEELITILYELAELKLEKATRLNNSSVSGDVDVRATNGCLSCGLQKENRCLHLKQRIRRI